MNRLNYEVSAVKLKNWVNDMGFVLKLWSLLN